jgi:hypothetical protein
MALGLAGHRLLAGRGVLGASGRPPFYIAQVEYRGGEWDPNPGFVAAIVEELELRTSIDARKERRVVTLADPDLFFCPFLYMAGRFAFEPFRASERESLRRFLVHGGFLLAEDTVGAEGFGFDRAFREEMQAILPDHPLKRLPADHSVYQSFYLINSFGGRQKVNPFLEGVTVDDWTPVLYSHNDLSGAWSRDRYGQWAHECLPEGELQRQSAFKMGINIISYALTADYKRDLIHHPFIKERRNL